MGVLWNAKGVNNNTVINFDCKSKRLYILG